MMICPLRASELIIGFLKGGMTENTFLKPLSVVMESAPSNSRIWRIYMNT